MIEYVTNGTAGFGDATHCFDSKLNAITLQRYGYNVSRDPREYSGDASGCGGGWWTSGGRKNASGGCEFCDTNGVGKVPNKYLCVEAFTDAIRH